MLSAGTLLCVHASFPFLVNVICGGFMSLWSYMVLSYMWFWWYTPSCRTWRSPICPVWGICPTVNLQKPLLWTIICIQQWKIQIYLQHYSFKWCYTLSQQMYSKFSFWFGINLQGIFDHFRWPSLTLSEDLPWSPLRATLALLRSVAPSPKSPKVSLQPFLRDYLEIFSIWGVGGPLNS